MKLGIDVSRYKSDQATGVEWYSKQIINSLLPLVKEEKEIEDVLFYSPHDFSLPTQSNKFTKRIIPFPRLWTATRLSYEILTKTPDILFVPSHSIPLIYPQKSVVTIHDVAFKRFRNAYSTLHYAHLNWSTKFAVKNAYRIIVPSEATKSDLMFFFKCEEEKIRVIHHGQPDFIYPDADNFPVIEKFGLKENEAFALFVGRLETKKNLIYLVDSFAEFAKEFPEWKLVLAGKDGIGADEIREKIQEMELSSKIILTGYISEKEKSALYNNSQFVVFPSLYEGFGFPILEAFQHRRPILTSKGSACQEIAQDCALIVDSHDKKDICEGMKKLASNKEYCDDLAKKGNDRLLDFSWDKAAQETLAVLMGKDE